MAVGGLEKFHRDCWRNLEIRRQIETIQTTVFLRSAWILRRVLETWEDFLSLKLQRENTSVSWCTFKIVDFAVPVDHRIILKESKKKDKYLDLARELKKLWNMKVTIVPIVIGALSTLSKGLLKGLEDLEVGGRVETIQRTALLRTATILRRVLETCGDLLSLKLQWETIS